MQSNKSDYISSDEEHFVEDPTQCQQNENDVNLAEDVEMNKNAESEKNFINEEEEVGNENISAEASSAKAYEDGSLHEEVVEKVINDHNQEAEAEVCAVEVNDCATYVYCISDENESSGDKSEKMNKCGLCCCGCVYGSYMLYKKAMDWSPPIDICCGCCCIIPALKLVLALSTCWCCCHCCCVFDDDDDD